jgi:hypothetical protein
VSGPPIGRIRDYGDGEGLSSIMPLGDADSSIIPLGDADSSIIPLGDADSSIIPLGSGVAPFVQAARAPATTRAAAARATARVWDAAIGSSSAMRGAQDAGSG